MLEGGPCALPGPPSSSLPLRSLRLCVRLFTPASADPAGRPVRSVTGGAAFLSRRECCARFEGEEFSRRGAESAERERGMGFGGWMLEEGPCALPGRPSSSLSLRSLRLCVRLLATALEAPPGRSVRSVTGSGAFISRRETSASRREAFISRREAFISRREPSISRREASISRREPSTSRREPSTSRREPSTSRRGPGTSRRGGSISRSGDFPSRNGASASRRGQFFSRRGQFFSRRGQFLSRRGAFICGREASI